MATGVALKSLAAGTEWDLSGDALSGRQVYVVKRGAPDTTAPNQVTVYQDSGLTTPYTQPLVTGADGVTGAIPGYVVSGQSIDFVDVQTNARTQAEALAATAVINASQMQFNALQYGAVGNGSADDTTPLQNAINAASTAGGGTVILPSGYTFLVSTIIPASNVVVWAYGATLKQSLPQTWGIVYSLPGTVGSSAVSNFKLLGATVVGTGSEATNNNVIFIAQGTNVEASDLNVSGYATAPIYFRDCTRVRAMRNTLLSCGTAGGSNPINVVQSTSNSTNPLQDCLIEGNIVLDSPTVPIDVVAATGATANSADTRVVIRGNSVRSTNSYGIGVELGGSGSPAATITRVVIDSNIVETTGGSTANAGIHVTNDSTTQATSTTAMADVSVTGNDVKSQGDGIFCNASRAVISGNRVKAAGRTVFCKGHGTITATGTVASSSTSVTSVTGDTGAVAGAQISGGNINSGTYIKSGVGSGTWTISKAAAGSATGESITISQPIEHLVISHNLLRVASNPLNPMITLQLVNRASVIGNRVFTDGGNTANTQQGCLIISSGWVNVQHNDWQYTPGHAVDIQASHDCLIIGNRIRNVGDGGTNSNGVNVQSSADLITVTGNTIVDDRSASQTTDAVNAAGTNVRVRDNVLLGAGTPIAGSPIQKTGNTYTAGAPSGTATLVAGTVTVSTAEVQSGDTIILSRTTAGGTLGHLSVGTITAGTSFVINSSSATDTSVVFWKIEH